MTARDGEERRLEILAVAGKLFLEAGYEGTSMARLASVLSCSKATLYAHFPSKEELFRSFVEERAKEEARTIFIGLDEGADPETVLKDFGRRFLELVLREDSVALLRLTYVESKRFPELGRSFYDHCLMSGHRLVTRYLRSLDGKGAYRFPDPELATEQFTSLCLAKFLDRSLLRILGPVDSAEIEAAIASGVRMFLKAHAAG